MIQAPQPDLFKSPKPVFLGWAHQANGNRQTLSSMADTNDVSNLEIPAALSAVFTNSLRVTEKPHAEAENPAAVAEKSVVDAKAPPRATAQPILIVSPRSAQRTLGAKVATTLPAVDASGLDLSKNFPASPRRASFGRWISK
jgi:hypothetical protein